MISCPNCGAENADNSNHCGNCGTKLHTGGAAKTMFGFAAISPEDMNKAAEQAKAASEAAANKPKLPSPSLPAPNVPAATSTPDTSATPEPKFNIPAPGEFSKSDAEMPTQAISAVENENDWGLRDTQEPGALAEAGAQLQESLASSGQHTTQPEPAIGTPTAPTPIEPPHSSGLVAQFGETTLQSASGGGSLSRRQKGEVRDPIKITIFVLLSCGIYGLFLLYNFMNDLNAGLGEERYNVVKEIVISMICGFYVFFLLWKICNDVVELQKQWGVEPSFEAPILFVLNFVYAGFWGIQTSLNNAWENGRLPA